jgi:hypothetical protein
MSGNVPKGLRGHHPVLTHPDVIPVPAKVSCEELGPKVPLMACSPKQWIAKTGMILRTVAGSAMYGMATPGGDEDQMGVCVEPPWTVIGHEQFEQYIYRTQPEGVCSGPGDLDLVVYGLRKYTSLATSGNPTVLLLLFARDEHVLYQTELGEELRNNRDMFLSRQAASKFAGYLASQRRGLKGERSGGTNNQGRADLREKLGFDAKFAGHMIRLGLQGVELLTTGHITLPIPEPHLTYLRDLRAGTYLDGHSPSDPKGKFLAEAKLAQTLALAEQLERQIHELAETSPLPPKPDLDAIKDWVVSAHMRHWGHRAEAC